MFVKIFHFPYPYLFYYSWHVNYFPVWWVHQPTGGESTRDRKTDQHLIPPAQFVFQPWIKRYPYFLAPGIYRGQRRCHKNNPAYVKKGTGTPPDRCFRQTCKKNLFDGKGPFSGTKAARITSPLDLCHDRGDEHIGDRAFHQTGSYDGRTGETIKSKRNRRRNMKALIIYASVHHGTFYQGHFETPVTL